MVDAPAHPISPVGLRSDWRWSGVPHPESPAGLREDFVATGLAHPNSPAGLHTHWGVPSDSSIEARAIVGYAQGRALDPAARIGVSRTGVRPAGSRQWAARLIASAELSLGIVGSCTARLEIVDLEAQSGQVFDFRGWRSAFGVGLDLSRSLAVAAGTSASAWQHVETRAPLTFADFEGRTDHVGESPSSVTSRGVESFILFGPQPKTGVIVLRFDSWGWAPSIGVDIEASGRLSPRGSAYPASRAAMDRAPDPRLTRW